VSTWRIIDANLNRASEGLRVLDDIARFVLNDVGLSKELRDVRHEVMDAARSVAAELLKHRASAEDIGADARATPKKDMASLSRANFKRVQEALRVLEETAKLPEARGKLDSDCFRKARFVSYTLEKQMFPKLLKHAG